MGDVGVDLELRIADLVGDVVDDQIALQLISHPAHTQDGHFPVALHNSPLLV